MFGLFWFMSFTTALTPEPQITAVALAWGVTSGEVGFLSWCSAETMLPDSSVDPFKQNQQFSQISCICSLQYLATGLIKLSWRKRLSPSFRGDTSLGGNTSFEYRGGVFLIWSTREAEWGGGVCVFQCYTQEESLSKAKWKVGQMNRRKKGGGKEKEGGKEERRREGRNWDSVWITIFPMRSHSCDLWQGKITCVWCVTVEIQFLAYSAISWQRDSGEECCEDFREELVECCLFFFYIMLSHGNLTRLF